MRPVEHVSGESHDVRWRWKSVAADIAPSVSYDHPHDMAANRQVVHAIVDELEESKLELALQALEEIQGYAFEVTEDEERELRAREAECASGDRMDARTFLMHLRRSEFSQSSG